MVEAAFVTHFPIPPIYPYLPFTPGYLTELRIAHMPHHHVMVAPHTDVVHLDLLLIIHATYLECFVHCPMHITHLSFYNAM